MQNMVQIRRNNIYFVTNKFFNLFSVPFKALSVERPRREGIVLLVDGLVVVRPVDRERTLNDVPNGGILATIEL